VKNQIMGGKVGLRCKGKTLLDVANFFFDKKFVDNAQQYLAKKMKTKNANVHNSLKVRACVRNLDLRVQSVL
jgi:hypothetical protein